MILTKKEIEHIAGLARLELTAEEQEKIGKELSSVLNFIDQLKEVDTAGVEPTAQVTGIENIFRADEFEDWPADEKREAIFQTPELENGQIKVKRVLE